MYTTVTSVDPTREALAAARLWLSKVPDGHRVTVGQLLDAAFGIQTGGTKRDQQFGASCLRLLGWVRGKQCRHNGRKAYPWSPPPGGMPDVSAVDLPVRTLIANPGIWQPCSDTQPSISNGQAHQPREYSAPIAVADRPVQHGCRVAAARPVGGGPRRVRVAHVTDIHFGSKHCDANALLRFLRLAADAGCEAVMCTGDVLDGFSEKLMHEQRAIGLDDQAKEAVEVLQQAPEAAVVGNQRQP